MTDHNEFNPLSLIKEVSPEIIGTSLQGSVVKAIKSSTGYIDGLYRAYCIAMKRLDEKAPTRALFDDLDEEIQSMLARLREIAEAGGQGAVSAATQYLDRIEMRRKQEEIPDDVVQDAREMAESLLRTQERRFKDPASRQVYSDIVTDIMREIGQ